MEDFLVNLAVELEGTLRPYIEDRKWETFNVDWMGYK
jgi:hypothetical protein